MPSGIDDDVETSRQAEEAPGTFEEPVVEHRATRAASSVKPARHVSFHRGSRYRTRSGRIVKLCNITITSSSHTVSVL